MNVMNKRRENWIEKDELKWLKKKKDNCCLDMFKIMITLKMVSMLGPKIKIQTHGLKSKLTVIWMVWSIFY